MLRTGTSASMTKPCPPVGGARAKTFPRASNAADVAQRAGRTRGSPCSMARKRAGNACAGSMPAQSDAGTTESFAPSFACRAERNPTSCPYCCRSALNSWASTSRSRYSAETSTPDTIIAARGGIYPAAVAQDMSDRAGNPNRRGLLRTAHRSHRVPGRLRRATGRSDSG